MDGKKTVQKTRSSVWELGKTDSIAKKGNIGSSTDRKPTSEYSDWSCLEFISEFTDFQKQLMATWKRPLADEHLCVKSISKST
jgi:hypothetical protein